MNKIKIAGKNRIHRWEFIENLLKFNPVCELKLKNFSKIYPKKTYLNNSKYGLLNYNCVFLNYKTQGQGHHNSVSQLLWARITYPTPSTFPVGRALTVLFSHEDWVRVYLTGDRTRDLRCERRVV